MSGYMSSVQPVAFPSAFVHAFGRKEMRERNRSDGGVIMSTREDRSLTLEPAVLATYLQRQLPVHQGRVDSVQRAVARVEAELHELQAQLSRAKAVLATKHDELRQLTARPSSMRPRLQVAQQVVGLLTLRDGSVLTAAGSCVYQLHCAHSDPYVQLVAGVDAADRPDDDQGAAKEEEEHTPQPGALVPLDLLRDGEHLTRVSVYPNQCKLH